jgi:hypothetical protein
MFRKDKKFLLHMWHPSFYSIKLQPEKGSKSRPRTYSVLEISKRSEGSKGFKESKYNWQQKGYRMVLNGNIKGYQRTRCNKGLLWHKYEQK